MCRHPFPLSLPSSPYSFTWQSILISTAISINKWQIAWRMGKKHHCIYDERRSKMDLNPVPSVIHMIHAEYREQGTQFSTNLCAWKCVFNYAVLGTSVYSCVYLAARVSCILYLAPCLWREWMNNFRLSVAESSLRIKSRARKVCSVNHRARPLLSYLTKVGGGVGGRRDLLPLLLLLVVQA